MGGFRVAWGAGGWEKEQVYGVFITDMSPSIEHRHHWEAWLWRTQRALPTALVPKASVIPGMGVFPESGRNPASASPLVYCDPDTKGVSSPPQIKHTAWICEARSVRRSFPPPHSGPSVLKQSPAPSISRLHLLWALLAEGEDFLAVTAWSPIQPGGLLLGKSGKGIGSLPQRLSHISVFGNLKCLLNIGQRFPVSPHGPLGALPVGECSLPLPPPLHSYPLLLGVDRSLGLGRPL